MAVILSGSTITQSGTDLSPAVLSSISGVVAPVGANLFQTINNLKVEGSLSIPKETIQCATLYSNGSAAILEIGSDNGNPLSSAMVYIQNPTNGFSQGAIYALANAKLKISNSNVIIAAGGGGAEVGAYTASAKMEFKNVIFYKLGAIKGWHYLGGNVSTFENVIFNNCECVFFNSSPSLAKGLSVLNSNWGFGVDSVNLLSVTLSNSVVPRAMIQNSNNMNLLDCKITDWVACRQGPAVGYGFIFSRSVSVGAIGNQKGLAIFRLYDKDNVVMISGTTDVYGKIVSQQVKWGKVSTARIGGNPDPNTLANKFTAGHINNNTGIGHDSGEYKLPLTAVFYKYEAEINFQSNIKFDVTNNEILSEYKLLPNIVTDANVTLSEAAAVAKLASSFSINTVTNTITVTANSTLDDLYDVMKAWKTRNVQSQLEYPTIGTQPVTANGDTLVTAMGIVGLEFLTAGTKFKKIQANATANGVFSNIAIIGNVIQDILTDLSGVFISGTLTYNTNTDITITITNTTIDTVVNNGTGIVTINRVNSTIANYADAEINFIDSTISVIGADAVSFHPTANDRDLNLNASGTFSGSTAFKFGSTINGSLMSGTLYLRCVAGGIPFDINKVIVLGDNLVDLGTTAQLASLSAKIDLTAKEASLNIVNQGVQKASQFKSHKTNI